MKRSLFRNDFKTYESIHFYCVPSVPPLQSAAYIYKPCITLPMLHGIATVISTKCWFPVPFSKYQSLFTRWRKQPSAWPRYLQVIPLRMWETEISRQDAWQFSLGYMCSSLQTQFLSAHSINAESWDKLTWKKWHAWKRPTLSQIDDNDSNNGMQDIFVCDQQILHKRQPVRRLASWDPHFEIVCCPEWICLMTELQTLSHCPLRERWIARSNSCPLGGRDGEVTTKITNQNPNWGEAAPGSSGITERYPFQNSTQNQKQEE